MISREEVREALTGPIASLKTPFTRGGEIDYPGLRRLIDRNLDGGSSSSLLTYGDSLFTLMTDDEIADVTRAVAEHTGRRGLTVAADGGWWTGKTVEFARYCREVGADVLMVKQPVWGASGTVKTSVEHYAAVAAEIPVMLVTNIWAGDTAKGLKTRAIAFGFLEAPLKGKLLLPIADLGDSVPLLQDVKANKPENTAGNYKCRPRKFQMRLPWPEDDRYPARQGRRDRRGQGRHAGRVRPQDDGGGQR